jgi:NRAMP (natural resistance-associated macrophage protein)-like metal ion transporter
MSPRASDPPVSARAEAAAVGARETQMGREPNPVRRFLKVLGPGLITGASDDDPSGIGTYAVAGASLGYAPLWLAPCTFPLMASVQFICAKIGLVSGRGLAGVLREHYPKALLYPVLLALLVANTINAGVDLGAIAAGINLLAPTLPIPLLVVPVTVAIVALQLWGSYRLIASIFKWLTLALFAYIGSALFARPDLGDVLKGTFLPALRWNGPFLATVVAILGTTISPYLFFWQASQEVEEKQALGRKHLWQRRGTSDAELKYAAWDVNVGMLFSNVVMYFIILASAATLYAEGARDVQTAADAARALRPLAGDAAALLMALGLVGSGFLAVPVLTGSASYAVCEAFGCKQGLDRKPLQAPTFYALIVGSSLVGMLVNFVGINPMQALFWTAVLNGFLAPPLLVVIMLIAGNRKVMGERANGPALAALGWATTALMFAAAVGLVLTGTAGK